MRCKCIWEVSGVALLVTFPDHLGKTLLLQGSDAIAAFARNCGQSPQDEKANSTDFDESDITECPEEYLDVADVDAARVD